MRVQGAGEGGQATGGWDDYQHMDKKHSFTMKLAEDQQTGAMVDRFSPVSEEDGSSQGVDKIKAPQGEEDQSLEEVDRVRILAKVVDGATNSGESNVLSQEGFKLQQMGRHSIKHRKKESSPQGNKVKLQEGFGGFQKVDKLAEDQTGAKRDRVSYREEDSSSQGADKIKVPQGEEEQGSVKADSYSPREEDGSSQWVDEITISQVDKVQTCGKPHRAFAKLLVREVVDERPAGEDSQVEEQQFNSTGADRCIEHEEEVQVDQLVDQTRPAPVTRTGVKSPSRGTGRRPASGRTVLTRSNESTRTRQGTTPAPGRRSPGYRTMLRRPGSSPGRRMAPARVWTRPRSHRRTKTNTRAAPGRRRAPTNERTGSRPPHSRRSTRPAPWRRTVPVSSSSIRPAHGRRIAPVTGWTKSRPWPGRRKKGEDDDYSWIDLSRRSGQRTEGPEQVQAGEEEGEGQQPAVRQEQVQAEEEEAAAVKERLPEVQEQEEGAVQQPAVRQKERSQLSPRERKRSTEDGED